MATNANAPEMRPVYRALLRPLTICGVDRRLFFLALLVGAAAFNLFYSFAAGCLLFAAIYGFARWSTARDVQMLQILLQSGRARARYDAFRHDVEHRAALSGHGIRTQKPTGALGPSAARQELTLQAGGAGRGRPTRRAIRLP